MRQASKGGFQCFCPTAAILLCEDVLDTRRQQLQIPLHYLLRLPHHDYCGCLHNAIQKIGYLQSWRFDQYRVDCRLR